MDESTIYHIITVTLLIVIFFTVQRAAARIEEAIRLIQTDTDKMLFEFERLGEWLPEYLSERLPPLSRKSINREQPELDIGFHPDE